MPHLLLVIGLIGYIIFRSSPPYHFIFVAVLVLGLVLVFTNNKKKKAAESIGKEK
ncbi:hypothetical protein MH117_13945 [Paenibacillus sp. ACRRX]|uniref:hypothetical protein n=1 Tax=unclassified Paenibacillus TaxID=185978 RepID=UPI001EF51081|nr:MULTISPECIES: hypothetical protein [unclassified Paenibacillus]MCG7408528.1 hypothetical protein [Paenibacillus sp. ACRRX]MDK8182776.1 hypothetical protein [Paenibacillus sp. UMB4589-SE434]